MIKMMRIAVDNAFDTLVPSGLPPSPVHVESVWTGIQFDPCACPGAGIHDRRVIDGVGFSFQKQSAGDVPQHMDIRVFGGLDQTIGELFFGLAKALMNAGDHHIQLGQRFIVKIEFTITQDVNLTAGQQSESGVFFGQTLVNGLNSFDLLLQSVRL